MKYLLHGQLSERLDFRSISYNDAEDWTTFLADPATSKYWIAEKQDPQIACTKWYDYQFQRYENDLGGMNALVERASGQFIGHCGLLVQTVDGEQTLEIGYSLLPAFWNKGYATEAAKQCMDFAFENNWTEQLISIISLTNIPSERVARKNGMQILKQTIYNNNEVNIFGINRADWEKRNV